MSLDILRRDAIASRRNGLTQSQRSLRRSKRGLRDISNLVSNNAALSTLILSRDASDSSPPPDADELAWLKASDIASGRYFDETSIPFPTTTTYTDLPHTSKPLRPSSQPSAQVEETIESQLAAGDAAIVTAADPITSSDQDNLTRPRRKTQEVRDSEDEDATAMTYSEKARQESEGPVVLPDQVAPPLPEEEAEFSSETQQLLDLQSPPKPAKVVHLPPSEDAPRDGSREADEKRRKVEDDAHGKTLRSNAQSNVELASSPSSTVGAYSATTPMPVQESPDTSPDSETAEHAHDVLPPADLRPSAEEVREKEQHDRLLAAQKDLARRAALGDVSSADDQLRFEDRQASARDAEERAAREDRNGPEPDAKYPREETEAEEVMDGVKRDKEESKGSDQDASGSEDGENITVTPRGKRPLSIDTSRTVANENESSRQPATQERMATRTSPGPQQKRRLSEMLGQTPSRAEFQSPKPISPTASRHMPNTPALGQSSSTFQLPRRPAPFASSSNSLDMQQSALDQLNSLKGAAEDPDRDYLEPLFRIQAHDSPNVHTTSLPDLIRASTKTLSTEDHFSTMHERLDYRILRRIYHLQNANKWSLRQMQPCKEPEQPLSQHDYMMAEMQWMRKDFKAERKMKKSVCAWLARRCAEWVAASPEDRLEMQVKVGPPKQTSIETTDEALPDLEHAEDSPTDEAGPPTPPNELVSASSLVVPPELADTVSALQEDGRLSKALSRVPVVSISDLAKATHAGPALTPVSKFATGKVLPKVRGPSRKRSRFDYEDGDEVREEEQDRKRAREERDQPPEDQENALFHPGNRAIRERLHANNAFRPPSEFVMPSTQFYEFRNGSQWLKEDDDKLKRLAKDYAFNWSLIADELQLTGIFKSSSERRTPWECFERWVELEQLPAEMKKTIYFKTWFQRLEQSQQASERRYQAQVAALQASQNGQATHVPPRRRTTPIKVEKRKNSRYIWLVEAMRKLARKKEQQAYKQAEAHRAAAQRKTSSENNAARPPMLTPQEFSKKRHEGDLRAAEKLRQDRQRIMEAQQRHIMAARQAAQQQQQQAQQAQQQQAQQQQGLANGAANQQRPGSSTNAPAQQAPMQANGAHPVPMNSAAAQQARQAMPMAQRNGHLAVPAMNAQGIPQAPMHPNGHVPSAQELAEVARRYANVKGRNPQYAGQQQAYQMPSANMMSPGGTAMTAQQINQNRQVMMAAAMQQQQQQQQQLQMTNAAQQANPQMSASPSMPPPPTPQNNPQSLSSGHVPALINIRTQLRNRFPDHGDEQINAMATEILKSHSQSSSQARQSAMNAAAGINGGLAQHPTNMQAYGHNQGAAYQAGQVAGATPFMNGDASGQPGGLPTSPQQYAALLRQRQMAQMRMQQSPNAAHASLNGSPGMANASPNMAPVSPNMQYSNMNQMAGMSNMAGGINGQQQRPPSRSNTPQMARVGSSGNMAGGMPSPQGVNGLQGSPRNMQASMAR